MSVVYAEPPATEDEETVTMVGTPLRDAAVDPAPGDFLPPTNAGVEDPHGPLVVSPGIHALQDMRPVRPGAVSDDPATQETDETGHLTAWQAAPADAAVSPATNNLTVGGTRDLVATSLYPDGEADVTWESSDEGVATVDDAGTVTAVAAGSATITATYSTGETATASVTVT